MCLYHYRQVPDVPHKNTVSKTGRLRVGHNLKGSKFKCNYSGHGNPVSQVFDDKNLELMK